MLIQTIEKHMSDLTDTEEMRGLHYFSFYDTERVTDFQNKTDE